MTATTTDLAIYQDAALHIKDQFEIDSVAELPEKDDNFITKLRAILAKRIEDMQERGVVISHSFIIFLTITPSEVVSLKRYIPLLNV